MKLLQIFLFKCNSRLLLLLYALFMVILIVQASQAKGWGKHFLRRPQWSDATGSISQPPDKFKLPSDWEWEDDEFVGDWEVMTSTDTGQFQTEGGQAKYVERIYEYQTRGPFSRWPVEDSDYLSTWKDEVRAQCVIMTLLFPLSLPPYLFLSLPPSLSFSLFVSLSPSSSLSLSLSSSMVNC